MRMMYRYRYQRQRADGSHNESTSLDSFRKFLKEAEEGDEFFVGQTEWVQVDKDGVITDKRSPLHGEPKVAKIDDVVMISRKDLAAMERRIKKLEKGK